MKPLYIICPRCQRELVTRRGELCAACQRDADEAAKRDKEMIERLSRKPISSRHWLTHEVGKK